MTQEFSDINDALAFIRGCTDWKIRRLGGSNTISMSYECGADKDVLRTAFIKIGIDPGDIAIDDASVKIDGRGNLVVMANLGFEFQNSDELKKGSRGK